MTLWPWGSTRKVQRIRLLGRRRPTPTPAPVFDLQKLAREPARWPKKVALRKASTFPAVLNGKAIGSLVAPVGAEANLQAIRDGKVALVYQGGGALAGGGRHRPRLARDGAIGGAGAAGASRDSRPR